MISPEVCQTEDKAETPKTQAKLDIKLSNARLAVVR